MSIIGIDTGSAKLAAVVVGDSAPVDVLEAATLPVDPKRLEVVVAIVATMAVRAGATRAAIEHGAKFYVPQDATRQQIMSMAEAHEICTMLERDLRRALEAEGIEVQTWARQSWAHRVVPHHQGGVTTALANEGVRGLCAPGSWERLRDQHQRDAGGVACMWLVDAPARPKRPSRARAAKTDPGAPVKPVLTPEQKVARRVGQWRESKRAHPVGGRPVDASAAERAVLGCTCTAKHRFGCPVLKERLRRQVEGARAHGSALRPDVFK